MKKSILAIIFMLAAVVVGSLPMWANKKITASKNYVTKTVNTGNFTGVYTISSIDIEYRQGPLKVQLYAPDNLVQYVKVKVSNDALTVYYDYNGSITINGNNTKLIVSAPNVASFYTMASGDIRISGSYSVKGSASFYTQGSGDIDAPSVKADDVIIATQGSGDIEITSIDAPMVKIMTQGSGEVDVTSLKASKATIMTQGSGDIEIASVKSSHATVQTHGSGNVEIADISATDVEAAVHASGDMDIKGKCEIAKYSNFGSGNISAKGMIAEIVTANVFGSGDINCYASKIIKGSELSTGELKVSGNPTQRDIKKRDR